ncbi:MAG: hypothetical protein WA192_16500 [Candidatus Acidiferrales bacterium]|jgi:hypothetical protein
MSLFWGCVWFAVGFAAAVPLTYLWTVHHRRLNAFEERLRSEKAESFQQGKEAAIQGLSFEQIESNSRRGIIRKRTYRVISERALLDGIPITPFYEYEVQIDENLDPKELAYAADAVRASMGLPGLAELGLKALPEKAAKKLI